MSAEPLAPSPGLLRLATRLAGPADAEDLVQATYVRALEHDGPVRSRPSWLRKVLLNEQRMQIRSRTRRDQREQTSTSPEEATGVDDVVHCLDVARVVRDLLDELDDDVRAVVRQRYFDGASAAEIARKHALPAGTVRWRLKAGLDRLRVQLDARYGGRRALWAGGFAPGIGAPTLLEGAASQPATASGTATAAAKGTSAMSLKILLGVAIVATTAGGVIAVGSAGEHDASESRTDAPQGAALVAARGEQAADDGRDDRTSPKAPQASAGNKAAWAARRSKIQAAHAAWSRPSADTAPTPSPEGEDPGANGFLCEGKDCSPACAEPDCFENLGTQVMGMLEGCESFLSHEAGDVRLTAKIIGAPDIGTIVESVEVDSAQPHQAELAECLTEAMYTLDLGAMDGNFAQSITVMLSGQEISPEAMDAMGDAERHKFEHAMGAKLDSLDDETRAKVEAVLAGEGEGAKVKVIHIDASEAG